MTVRDADFSEVAALCGSPPKVVWLRGGNRPTASVHAMFRRQLEKLQAFVGDGDGDGEAARLEIR